MCGWKTLRENAGVGSEVQQGEQARNRGRNKCGVEEYERKTPAEAVMPNDLINSNNRLII